MHRILLFLVGLIVFILTTPVGAQGSWSQMQALPASAAARDRAVGYSINGKGYVALGWDANNTYYRSNWEFDPGNNSWTQMADLPVTYTERCRSFSFVIGGKAIIGTGTDGASYLIGVFSFDPLSNSWVQLSNFPGGARYGASAFTIGQKGYVMGGYNGATVFSDVWEYTPASDSWVQKASIPVARYSGIGFSIGNYGYCGTGYNAGYLNDLWRFDPITNSWAAMPDLPGPVRALSTAFSIGPRAYIVGGSDAGPVALNDFWEFNSLNQTWVAKPSLPFGGRFAASSFTIGGRGYISCGNNDLSSPAGNVLKDIWEYTPAPLVVAQFQKTYGSTSDDTDADTVSSRICYGTVTADGGYIIASTSKSFGPTKDIYVIRTNTMGDTLWTRIYGNSNNDETVSSIRQNQDAGYIMAGMMGPYTASEMLVTRLQSNGGIQWVRINTGPGIQRANYAEELPNGQFLVTGRTDFNSFVGAGIYKLDAGGNHVVAPKTINRSGATHVEGFYAEQSVINGVTVSGEMDVSGNNDALLLFSDQSLGAFSTYNFYSQTTSVEERMYIKENPDGSYIACGTTNATTGHGGKDIFLVKFTSTGGFTWGQLYGGPNHDVARAIERTPDGGYVIAGFTRSVGSGGYDALLMKVNSTGVPIFMRAYGGSLDEKANALSLAPDGGYAIFGETRSFGAGGTDILFVKADSAGSSGCHEKLNVSFPAPITLSFTVTGPSAANNSPGSTNASLPPPRNLPGQKINLCTSCTFGINIGGTHATCFAQCNGSATVIPASGATPFTYSWSNGQTAAATTGLCAGLYSVTVTDAAGCTAVDTITILQPPQVIPNITSSTGQICKGGSATLTSNPTGGVSPFTYSWSPTAGLSCASCQSTTATPTIATTYSLLVTDKNGCTGASTYSIGLHPSPVANLNSLHASCNGLCNGGIQPVNIAGSPPFTFSWQPGGQTTSAISNLCPNTYSVTITDSKGCSAISIDTILQPPVLTSTAIPTTSSCCNGTVTAQANGGSLPYTYSWQPGGQTTSAITGLCPGGHTVTITDAKGCTKSASAIVGGAPSFTLASMAPTTICSGSSATLTASTSGPGVISYSWSPGNYIGNPYIVSPSSTTTYTVTATDTASGCSHSTTVAVGVVLSPTATITGPTTICANTPATLTGGGTGSYLWSPGGQTTSTINGMSTAAGTYTFSLIVTASSANLTCKDTATHVINVVSSPAVSAAATSYTLCAGVSPDTLFASNIPGAIYSWSSNPPGGPYPNNDTIIVSPDPLGPHTYTVTVSLGSGCSGISTVTINVSQGFPTPSVAPATMNYCFGDSMQPITCTNAVTNVGWLDAQGNLLFIGNPFTPSVSAVGTYSFLCVQGTGNYCLSYPAMATVNIHALPKALAGADLSLCAGHTANLSASGGVAYSWSPSSFLNNPNISNPSCSPDSSFGYQVIVTDINGCRDIDSISITVLLNDTCGIHIYNGITPNGDGNNDVWWIDGITLYGNNVVEIFNRWGHLVWSATNYDNKKVAWIGQNYNYEALPAGTYYYVIDIQNLGRFKGWVELLR